VANGKLHPLRGLSLYDRTHRISGNRVRVTTNMLGTNSQQSNGWGLDKRQRRSKIPEIPVKTFTSEPTLEYRPEI
jgi:hypothetical protein